MLAHLAPTPSTAQTPAQVQGKIRRRGRGVKRMREEEGGERNKEKVRGGEKQGGRRGGGGTEGYYTK